MRESTNPLVVCAAVLALAIPRIACAGESLYKVRASDVGWNQIDLTVSETQREGRISQFHIPHYASRSAAESRFVMCAFTDVAVRRDFTTWIAVEGSGSADTVRVGYLRTSEEDPATVLGKEFVGSEAMRVEVDAINRLCGIEKVPK